MYFKTGRNPGNYILAISCNLSSKRLALFQIAIQMPPAVCATILCITIYDFIPGVTGRTRIRAGLQARILDFPVRYPGHTVNDFPDKMQRNCHVCGILNILHKFLP